MLLLFTTAKSLLWGGDIVYSIITCIQDALFKIANTTEPDMLRHMYFRTFANVF